MKKFVLPLLLVAAISASAQKVSNKFGLKSGQTIESVSDMSITTEMPMMGESKNSVKTTEHYAVKNVSGSSATLEKSIKHIKLDVSVMGQEQKIDSDKPEDLNGQSGETIKELLKHKQEFTIDANGRIVSVAGTAKKEDGGSGGMLSAMLEQMNGASSLSAGTGSIIQVLPAYAVGVGDTWTDSTKDAKGKGQTTYTVKSVTGSDMLIDFISSGTIDTKQEMMGMSADMKGTVKSTGIITVDTATGLPKQKTTNGVTEMAISVAGQDMNVTTKTVGTQTFTLR